MISKSWQKRIRALHRKKERATERQFLVEGAKSVYETLNSLWHTDAVFYTEKFANQYGTACLERAGISVCTSQTEIEAVGTLQSNDGAIAVVRFPELPPIPPLNGYALALADIRDPGNLGTILRIADWYGIQYVYCSETTVDWHNAKSIAASMGSFLRVPIYEGNLAAYLAQMQTPVYGTMLNGINIYEVDFASSGIILIGNESQGIGTELFPYLTQQISIPRFGEAESLNAGIATAVVLDNWRRQQNLRR